jgi:hemoglobin
MERVEMTTDTAITERRLRRLVSAFYARVRCDELLAPVFAEAVEDWPAHVALLTDFWSSVMLTSGRYKGNPVAAHALHRAAITPAHFDRWLAIWREVTSMHMPASAAQALQAKADRIGESLQLALFFKMPPVRKGVSA